MRIKIESAGELGVIKDIAPFDLPPPGWSDVKNVEISLEGIRKSPGFSAFLSNPTGSPYAIFSCSLPGQGLWVYLNNTDAYAIQDGSLESKITRVSGTYTGGLFNCWNYCAFNNQFIFNNGVDKPQVWSPIAVGTKLIDLANFTAGGGDSLVGARIVSFLNFLILLNVTRAGVNYPFLVKWSAQAASGVPSSWDETDATKAAGQVSLGDQEEACVDGLTLGATLLIYKERSVWACRFVGGQNVFNFYSLFPSQSQGILAQGCAAQFENQHFVVSKGDIFTHDGQTITGRADKRVRKWIFNNLDPTSYIFSKVFVRYDRTEVWFCFPLAGSGVLNCIAKWNWREDKWAFQDLPNVLGISASIQTSVNSPDTWDYEAAQTWDGGPTNVWDDPNLIKTQERMLFGEVDTPKILELDQTGKVNTLDGAAYRSYAERQKLAISGLSQLNQPVRDIQTEKLVKGVYPHFSGATGTVVQVYVGYSDLPDETPTWLGPFPFTIGTTDWITPTDSKGYLKSGRFISIRFDETQSGYWELRGFDLEIEPMGEF